ncbi:MAG: CHASE domain-containing protein, partial [Thermodesulfobacteriota bacterium]
VLATWTAYSVYGSRDQDRFERRVSEISDALEARLATYVVLLHAASALIRPDGDVDEPAFRAFVERIELHARYPGLRGIGFVVRVPAARRAAFEQRVRSGGAAVTIRPERERPEYFPVVALEPHDDVSHATIGLDMASDDRSRAAMERARDSGLPAASAALPLPAATGAPGTLGVLLFVPVYRSPTAPPGVEAKRSDLVGFVFSSLSVADFITASVPPNEHAQVAFRVLDGAQGDDAPEIYASDPAASAEDDTPTFARTSKLDMAGQDWTIGFRTLPPFDDSSRLPVVAYVLAGGCLISMLLFVAMRTQSRARHQAEHNASVLQTLLLARRESEARRAAILESSIDAVIAMDESGRITEFNRAAEQTFGYSRPEVLGRDLFDTIIPASYRAELRDGFARYLETGEGAFLGQRLETTARRRDGSDFAAEVTVSEIGLDSGREFTAHVRDITERREYEERLRVERETVETLHRVTSSFAAKLDLQSLVQDAIDAATVASGAECGAFFYSGPNDDARGEERIFAVAGVDRAVFDELSLPRPTALLGATFSRRLVVRLDDVAEDPRQGKNAPHFGLPIGHPSVRSYLAVPVVTGGGAMLGSILLGHSRPGSFTERHESVVLAIAAQAAVAIDKALLYRAAQEARNAAELANRAKDEFLATLSHELRTPLTAILGWCQLLTRGKRSEAEVARGLERIESSAQAQTRLISDLLDVSRIVSGKLRLEVQPLDLEPIVEAAIESIRPAAEAKMLDVRTVIDPSSLVVAGDASRLQQVFWNLLSNAVKFTPKGGRIEVRVDHLDGQAVIDVRDDGCGIRPEDLACVFDRFRQVDSSTTRRSGGLGLGLAIVRHLVELHGGAVSAHSEGEGRGATFRVSLPLLAVRASAAVSADGARAAADAGHEAHVPPLAGLRVLVVDDDGETRELIKVILEEFGAEVCAVASVTRALDALARLRPDVLVSDIAMPERDGYDLIRHVRGLRDEEGGKIPALALTAFARSEDCRRALLAGFQMHAAKPVEPDELVSMVAALARRPGEAEQQWP